MVLLRRLLTGLLVFAVAHFGVLATAPAHAHESGDGHGVREIVLSQAHDVEHHHSHDDEGGAGHQGEASLALGDASAPDSDEPSHGEHAHVHVCPQFTPLANHSALRAPVMLRELLLPARGASVISYLGSPPLRPPRTIL
jgi:hypothetical protein